MTKRCKQKTTAHENFNKPLDTLDGDPSNSTGISGDLVILT